MTSKLELYNKALGFVGSGRILTLAADREERYELDAIYDGALQYMLELAGWKFALRSSLFVADADIEPGYGLPYAYAEPTDFKRIAAISPDEYFHEELMDYRRENGVLYTSAPQFYMVYVSNHADYGGDLGRYPETYAEALAAWMAVKAALPISKDRGDRAELMQIHARLLAQAKQSDAINERVKWTPEGSWVRSRTLGRGRPYTRGGRIGGF